MSFALEVALTADFDFCAIDPKGTYVGKLCQLLTAGFFHQGVAVDASDSPARMRARFPVSLHPALMTTKTCCVLDLGGFTRILAKRDQPAHAFSTAGRNVVAAGTVTVFAGPLLSLVARIEEKDLAHLRLGEFLKGGSVAGFANFVANVGRGSCFGGLFFR